jgi:uncharacterized protein (DUF433 family)
VRAIRLWVQSGRIARGFWVARAEKAPKLFLAGHVVLPQGRFEQMRYTTHMNLLERITITPDVRSGKPCIAGTRITVYDILEYLAGGMSETEILADFPSLTQDDLRAVLTFAAVRERRLASMAA